MQCWRTNRRKKGWCGAFAGARGGLRSPPRGQGGRAQTGSAVAQRARPRILTSRKKINPWPRPQRSTTCSSSRYSAPAQRRTMQRVFSLADAAHRVRLVSWCLTATGRLASCPGSSGSRGRWRAFRAACRARTSCWRLRGRAAWLRDFRVDPIAGETYVFHERLIWQPVTAVARTFPPLPSSFSNRAG